MTTGTHQRRITSNSSNARRPWDPVVYVVFGSGVMVKPQVHEALRRLKGFLESRGAEVWVIYLPHGEDSEKQGVNEYLVAGHTIDDLLAHTTTELREPPWDDEDEEPAVRYRENPHRMVWGKLTLHRTCSTPLTNFLVEIVADGVEREVEHGT
jgi:hypothetical protein